MVMSMKLLLIEDDSALHESMRRALTRVGWTVEVCADGRLALERWSASGPEVVLLDLTLPGMDGLEILAKARRRGLTTPVLILTARGTVGDRILGLNAGADDYMPKPFDLDELEARVRALHRRSAESSTDDSNGRDKNALRFDKTSGAIYYRDQVLELTPRELSLLTALLLRPGRAVTKEKLFELVFPGEVDVKFEAVEVVAYRLRKKLVPTGAKLMTLRGLGYLLKVNA
jgi:two-component system response regulator TctD